MCRESGAKVASLEECIAAAAFLKKSLGKRHSGGVQRLNLYVHMAVGQNQWYQLGVGAPPILVYFSWNWDVHWGYGILTHGHMVPQLGALSHPFFGWEGSTTKNDKDKSVPVF